MKVSDGLRYEGWSTYRRRANFFVCDLKKQLLPHASVWVTVFPHPDLYVADDETVSIFADISGKKNFWKKGVPKPHADTGK